MLSQIRRCSTEPFSVRSALPAAQVMLTAHHLCLVMELAAGGTLTQYVAKRQARGRTTAAAHLSEDEARYYFRVRCLSQFWCLILGPDGCHRCLLHIHWHTEPGS